MLFLCINGLYAVKAKRFAVGWDHLLWLLSTVIFIVDVVVNVVVTAAIIIRKKIFIDVNNANFDLYVDINENVVLIMLVVC